MKRILASVVTSIHGNSCHQSWTVRQQVRSDGLFWIQTRAHGMTGHLHILAFCNSTFINREPAYSIYFFLISITNCISYWRTALQAARYIWRTRSRRRRLAPASTVRMQHTACVDHAEKPHFTTNAPSNPHSIAVEHARMLIGRNTRASATSFELASTLVEPLYFSKTFST